MRVRRVHVSTSKKGKPFYRFDVTLPARVVARLSWDAGTALDYDIKDGELRLRVAKAKRPRERL